MAKRFTRNIRSIEDITKQPKYTNEQNDLLSDDKEIYIRNQGKYEKITGNVEKVNNKEPDDRGNVEIDTGVMEVNDQTPDNKGNVEIDTGVHKVNGKDPDEQGNIELDYSDKNYLLDSKKRVLEERSSNFNYDIYYLSEPIPAGTEFTVSGKLEITDGDFDAISILFRDENDDLVDRLFRVEYINNEFSSSLTLSKTIYKFYIYTGIYGSTQGNGVIYTDVKLQTGPLATPWTPNPQQIVTQDQYDKLANAIINLGGSI